MSQGNQMVAEKFPFIEILQLIHEEGSYMALTYKKKTRSSVCIPVRADSTTYKYMSMFTHPPLQVASVCDAASPLTNSQKYGAQGNRLDVTTEMQTAKCICDSTGQMI